MLIVLNFVTSQKLLNVYLLYVNIMQQTYCRQQLNLPAVSLD